MRGQERDGRRKVIYLSIYLSNLSIYPDVARLDPKLLESTVCFLTLGAMYQRSTKIILIKKTQPGAFGLTRQQVRSVLRMHRHARADQDSDMALMMTASY